LPNSQFELTNLRNSDGAWLHHRYFFFWSLVIRHLPPRVTSRQRSLGATWNDLRTGAGRHAASGAIVGAADRATTGRTSSLRILKCHFRILKPSLGKTIRQSPNIIRHDQPRQPLGRNAVFTVERPGNLAAEDNRGVSIVPSRSLLPRQRRCRRPRQAGVGGPYSKTRSPISQNYRPVAPVMERGHGTIL